MLDANTLKKLKELSEDFTLLYVEDNEGLRKKALNMLNKLFSNVISASDGEEGYTFFKEHRPHIVITDISMPKLDGLEMIDLIKKLEPSTKFIITSAFDDKKYLLQAIDAGVFNYMKKPIKVDALVDVLMNSIKTILSEKNSSVFNNYMEDMINHQSDILALVTKGEFLFVNKMFLKFFDVENIDTFNNEILDFGSLLLEHKGFLYNHDEVDWFAESTKQADKLFHVKISDKDGENRHFILKMHPLPNKENMYVMSLNDISDLKLLSIFDSKAVANDEKIKSRSTILNLLEVIQKNSAEIKVHNYYKGLTVTNVSLVESVNEEQAVVRVPFIQQKAAQHENNLYITSEIFPNAIFCSPLKKVDFEKQLITLEEMHFLVRNPTQRKVVRVEPEEHHGVSLFVDDRKFYSDISINDISVEAVKLEVSALPAGIKVGSLVTVDIVLEDNRKPIIINTQAEVLRIDEKPRNFYIVLIFNLTSEHKKLLVDYVAKRQMNLIREFKGLQFG